jgi:hypothetical protein
MNAEEAKAFLKDRGIPTMNYPHGHLLKMRTIENMHISIYCLAQLSLFRLFYHYNIKKMVK